MAWCSCWLRPASVPSTGCASLHGGKDDVSEKLDGFEGKIYGRPWVLMEHLEETWFKGNIYWEMRNSHGNLQDLMFFSREKWIHCHASTEQRQETHGIDVLHKISLQLQWTSKTQAAMAVKESAGQTLDGWGTAHEVQSFPPMKTAQALGAFGCRYFLPS